MLSSGYVPLDLRKVTAALLVVALAGALTQPRLVHATARAGGVSIESDPNNAAIYIDSRRVGETPVELQGIVSGTHRLRVVKQGYLENSRIVTVRPGQPTQVSVKLTRIASDTLQTPPAGPSTSGWMSNKWVWIGAAGGAAVAATLALTKNAEPTPGAIVVSPNGVGMAGQTAFTFQSTATDPESDPLTLTWNFGDGGSGSGNNVTHTYATAGTFQVQLSISDGKHTVDAPNVTVTVGPSLAGTWTGGSILMPDATGRVVVNCGLSLSLSQNGATLSGAMSLVGNCSVPGIPVTLGLASLLTHPSGITLISGPFSFAPAGSIGTGLVISFAGTTSGTGTTMTGNVTLNQPSTGFTQTTATSFTRQ